MKNLLYLFLACLVTIGCGNNATEPATPLQNDSLLLSFSPDTVKFMDSVTVRGKEFGNDIDRVQIRTGDVYGAYIKSVSDSLITFTIKANAMTGRIAVMIDSIPHFFASPIAVRPTLYLSNYSGKPGDSIIVLGYNLGADATTTSIHFGTQRAQIVKFEYNKITVIVPSISSPCLVTATVLGTAGSTASPFNPVELRYQAGSFLLEKISVVSELSSNTSTKTIDTIISFAQSFTPENSPGTYTRDDTTQLFYYYNAQTYSKYTDYRGDTLRRVKLISNSLTPTLKWIEFEDDIGWAVMQKQGSGSSSTRASFNIVLQRLPFTEDAEGNMIVQISGTQVQDFLHSLTYQRSDDDDDYFYRLRSTGTVRAIPETKLTIKVNR